MSLKPPDAAVELIEFWRAAGWARWFSKDAAFDAEFRARFLETHFAAARCELEDWLGTAGGALGLVLLLDQFPRNAFRGTAHMFATDGLARAIATRALEAGIDSEVDAELRLFMYLPFMHSEALADQDRSVALNTALGDDQRKYAVEHRDIVRRFGRFPHRNAVLGRETTPAERAWLEAHPSGF